MTIATERPPLRAGIGWAGPLPLPEAPELSVVMPCLDEEATIGRCVEKALLGIARSGLSGEVIVSDNGSVDRSVAIALVAGARVVHQPQRGYGRAYQAGFAAARGRYLIMGDSDDTYDFAAIAPFVALLRSGAYDYVLGSRFKGTILSGAMPWHHRYIGNPLLTGLLNCLFGLDSSDAHSGMRAFTREAYARMQLRSPGMEFASEIVVNAAKARLRITEVPITYYPRAGESKLRSFRDGWRHLRYLLLHSPEWLFLVPSAILFLCGLLVLLALALAGGSLGGNRWALPSAVLATSCAVLGGQLLSLGLAAKAYTYRHGFAPHDRFMSRFSHHFSLERGLLAGCACCLAGSGALLAFFVRAAGRDPGAIDTLWAGTGGLIALVLGVQILFSSCLLALLHALPAAEPATVTPVGEVLGTEVR